MLNNFISFIAFKIYKYKMFCRVTNEKETLFGIQNYIKRQTKLYYYTLLKTDVKFDCKTFDKMSEIL